jgi:hypothetical protein
MTAWTIATVPPFAAQLARAHRPILAELARKCYSLDGRGLVTLTYRGDEPGAVPTVAELHFGYMTAATYRERTAAQRGQGAQIAADVLRRVATYDPASHMVVVCVVGPAFLTTTFLVPLDPAVVLEQADGIH